MGNQPVSEAKSQESATTVTSHDGKKTGAQILFESLIAEGVDTIFGYPGGAVLPQYDTLPQYPQINHILVRHEQGAGFAASGYARVSGRPGVVLATSGPGATNTLTAIADSWMDSIPIIVITGQVPLNKVGTDAFQETDIIGMTLPVVKHNYMLESPHDIQRVIKEAFYIATTGRPGPVLIDIPKDIMIESIKPEPYPETVNLPGFKPKIHPTPEEISNVIAVIKKSQKPIIIAGHGVLMGQATQELVTLVEQAQIPVINTVLGLGSINEDHPLAFGMLGMHGHAHANFAAHEADLIIGIGMRFDDRITGKLEEFGKNADIIHIDIDPAEIGKLTHISASAIGDCKYVLAELMLALKNEQLPDFKPWIKSIEMRRDDILKNHKTVAPHLRTDQEKITAGEVIRMVHTISGDDTICVTDVGQHQMFVGLYYRFSKPNTIVTSGGLGSMGFGLPAAMGAKVAKPDTPVWGLLGDGGFQMNIQELMTISEYNIPVKIGIMNNSFLGMVRQWQELFYKKNYVAVEMRNPDYEYIAKAYSIPFYRVKNREELEEKVKQAQAETGPVIVEFIIEPEENVFPMVPAGFSLGETLITPNSSSQGAEV